jgi:hypothetical protein
VIYRSGGTALYLAKTAAITVLREIAGLICIYSLVFVGGTILGVGDNVTDWQG